MVSGIPKGNVMRIQVANASNHSGLYKYDMVSEINICLFLSIFHIQ